METKTPKTKEITAVGLTGTSASVEFRFPQACGNRNSTDAVSPAVPQNPPAHPVRNPMLEASAGVLGHQISNGAHQNVSPSFKKGGIQSGSEFSLNKGSSESARRGIFLFQNPPAHQNVSPFLQKRYTFRIWLQMLKVLRSSKSSLLTFKKGGIEVGLGILPFFFPRFQFSLNKGSTHSYGGGIFRKMGTV
ncbi:MAG: hypothetical protein WCT19_03365 [Candidatus Paceibacterota bacterium]